MYGDVGNGDVSSGCGSINIHTVYKHNGFKSLINYNDRCDIDIIDHLNNIDVSSGIGLINRYTLSQFNLWSNLNYIDWGVENADVSSGHFI